MKKIALFLMLSLLASPVFAKSVSYGFGGSGEIIETDCNPSTEYCVLIKGDSSLTEPVTALIKEEGEVKGKVVRHTFEKPISAYEDVYFNGADVKLLRLNYVTYVNVGVFKVNNQPISNCYFMATGKIIAPGLHTLVLSKTEAGGYTCQKF